MLINKRMKSYTICLRTPDGEITAIADYPFKMEPARSYCHLWSFPPVDCLRYYKQKYPNHEVFIVRIGSKDSPIEINWDEKCYRWPVNRKINKKVQ